MRSVETGEVYPSMAAAAEWGGSPSGIRAAIEKGAEYRGSRWEFDGTEKAGIERRLAEIASAESLPEVPEALERRDLVEGLLGDGPAPAGVEALADGLAVKNKLPARLGADFKTEAQWEDLGLEPRLPSRAVPMHPTRLSRSTRDYCHVPEVVSPGDDPGRGEPFLRRQGNLALLLAASAGHGGLSANFPNCEGY